MRRGIFYLLILGLIVRLGLAYFQYSGDVNNHLAWGRSLLTAGSTGFYSRHFPGFNDANYPPLTIYLFGLAVYLYQISLTIIETLNQSIRFFPSILVPLWSSTNAAAAFLKLPAIIADLGVGYILYRLSAKKLPTALYLFNPAVFYISAVWGQIESLPIFFFLLSYSLVKKHYLFSHLTYTLAILSKQTALWLLPVFLVIWWKEGGWRRFLTGLAGQLAVFFLLYLPFAAPPQALTNYLATLSGSSTLISDQAFNLWYWLFAAARLPDSLPVFGLSVRLWSLFLLAPALLLICFRLLSRYSYKRAISSLLWLSLAVFFLMTRVHDRHLAPALPLLLLADIPFRLRISSYFALSIYHMINLYLALRLPLV